MNILISACLIGERVRYDGKTVDPVQPDFLKWINMNKLIPFCPEVAGGMTVPRWPSEIIGGDGFSVLNGSAGIVDSHRRDVTNFFLKGAEEALKLVKRHEIKIAVLKDGSPSCGTSYIYDGSFSKQKKPGKGVASALLEQNGIRVFSENNFDAISLW